MSRIGALALLPLAMPPPAAAQETARPATTPLALECDGVAARGGATTVGRSPRSTGKSRRSHSDDGPDRSTATAGHGGSGVAVRFVFEIDGDHGRVRYPAAITPVVHSGGDAGWWPIRALAVDDDAFSGRIALNLFNTARFTIDRRTGSLDLSGLDTRVTGRCAKASTATPRLF